MPNEICPIISKKLLLVRPSKLAQKKKNNNKGCCKAFCVIRKRINSSNLLMDLHFGNQLYRTYYCGSFNPQNISLVIQCDYVI